MSKHASHPRRNGRDIAWRVGPAFPPARSHEHREQALPRSREEPSPRRPGATRAESCDSPSPTVDVQGCGTRSPPAVPDLRVDDAVRIKSIAVCGPNPPIGCLSAVAKEVAQQLAGLSLSDAAINLRPVM